jgi:hypothetical protein
MAAGRVHFSFDRVPVNLYCATSEVRYMANIDRPQPTYDFSAPIWNNRRNLKRWRKLLGVGQAELAETCSPKVSQAAISALELGVEPFTEPLRTKVWTAIAKLRAEGIQRRAAMEQRTVDISDPIALMNEDPTGYLYPPEPGKTPMQRLRGRCELLTERCKQLAGECANWKYRALWAKNLANQLLKERDELRDILNLETASAMTANEAMGKIKALGLQKRSQSEEEFRSEMATFEGTQRTAGKGNR